MTPFTDQFDSRGLVYSIWGEATLPDARLLPRLRKTVEMFIERLEAPTTSVARKLVVGARRLFDNDRVTSASLVDPMLNHQVQLVSGAAALIVAHDTMELDLTGRYEPDDAGPLRASSARGHLLHWSLAIDPVTRRPLAALACNVWTRPWETRKDGPDTRPPHERESYKWKREILAVIKLFAAHKIHAVLTHVADREGDTHDNFTFTTEEKIRFVTRAQHDHAIAQAPGSLWKLLAVEDTWEGATTCAREVPTKASESSMKAARAKGRAEVDAVRATLKEMGGHRAASLRVRWARVTLAPDKNKKKSEQRKPVKVWVVHVREQDVPVLAEPLEWVLLTTVPVETIDDALWIVDAYRSRWPIEPMHAVLKTGLHVEKQGGKDVASTRRLLAVMLPVSLHLMRWAYGWRENPQELASKQVPEDVIGALRSACRYHKLPLPRREWTLKDFVLRLAALGGDQARPDRTPGWLVLWRGWRKLLEFWRVVNFAQNAAGADLPNSAPWGYRAIPRGS